MTASLLDQVVEAVLYEGYILYPYRPSSKKNRERFTFGRVYPQAYSAAQNGAEPCLMQTECLFRPQSANSSFRVTVGFLHPIQRDVVREPGGQPVAELEVDGTLYQSWQEAVERRIEVGVAAGRSSFAFPASRVVEPIRDQQGRVAAAIVRQQEGVEGGVEISSEPVDAHVTKITVRVLNLTPMTPAALEDPAAVLRRTFASTHTILQTSDGEFLSMTDPPEECKQTADQCQNLGTWPVLIGDETQGRRDTLLSSPIILPDYPKIAAESAGSLYDGTEIDEILTLRILTMTDAEKREMRHTDEHARRLLERTEAMPGDRLLKMHGVMRATESFDEQIFGGNERLETAVVGDVRLRAGDVVRIRPKVRADAIDMLLAGKAAVIEAVEMDAEGKVHLALVLQDDPGKDLGLLRQPGHRFFYGLDEIEPLQEGV